MELKELIEKFKGEALTEDLIKELVTGLQEHFETQASDHATEIEALKEAHAQAFATANDVTAERIKEAADAAVQTMLAENEQRFVTADQHERAMTVLGGLRQLFEANGFDLKGADEALTESLNSKTEAHADAIKRLGEARAQVASLTESLQTANRAIMLAEMTQHLSAAQRDKLTALSEGLTFADDEGFKKSMAALIEGLNEAAPGEAEKMRNLEKEKKAAAMGGDAGTPPATVPVGSGGTDKKEIDALKEAALKEANDKAELESLTESLHGLDPLTCTVGDLKAKGLTIHALPHAMRQRFYA